MCLRFLKLVLGYTKVGRSAERFATLPKIKALKYFWFYCSPNWYMDGGRENMALNKYFTNRRNLIKSAVVAPSSTSRVKISLCFHNE